MPALSVMRVAGPDCVSESQARRRVRAVMVAVTSILVLVKVFLRLGDDGSEGAGQIWLQPGPQFNRIA